MVLSPHTKYTLALYIPIPCHLWHEVASCTVIVSSMPQQTNIVDSNKTSTTSAHVLYIMFELHKPVHVQYLAIVHTNTRRIDRFSENQHVMECHCFWFLLQLHSRSGYWNTNCSNRVMLLKTYLKVLLHTKMYCKLLLYKSYSSLLNKFHVSLLNAVLPMSSIVTMI